MNKKELSLQSHEEDENDKDAKDGTKMRRDRILAALFYGGSSLLVIFINKIIMSEYNFPYFDFLAAVQFLATTIILSVLIVLRKIDSIPAISFSVVQEVLPISVMFLGNVLCGLGSTRSLNLPMFTALRRFSILMTMVAESCLLGAKPSSSVTLSVAMMVGGAVIAAIYDLSFDAEGYTLVFMNNVFTALNGVWMKKALGPSGQCSKMAVLYYNSLFCGITMLLFFSAQHAATSHANSLGVAMSHNSVLSSRVSQAGEAILGVSKGAPLGLSGLPALPGYAKAHGAPEARGGSRRGLDAGPVVPVIQTSSMARMLTGARMLADSTAEFLANAHPDARAGEGGAGEGSEAPDDARLLRGARRGSGASSIDKGQTGRSALDSEFLLMDSTITKILAFPGWARPDFLALFLVASIMGSILNYSIFVCTTLNSALTTAVIGCLKNVLTTYVGMLFFADYLFQWTNFVGLNISILGSLYYTYITLFKGHGGYGA